MRKNKILHKIFLRSSDILRGKCVSGSLRWFTHSSSHHRILWRCSCFCWRLWDDPWVIEEESLGNGCAKFKFESFDMFNFAGNRFDVVHDRMERRWFTREFLRKTWRRHIVIIIHGIFTFIYFKMWIHVRKSRVIEINFFLFRAANSRCTEYLGKQLGNVHFVK